jgi:ABC-type transporter Mla subunit MlaD
MTWRPRVVSIGGLAGMVGAILGVGAVQVLRADLGWLVGLLAGGAAGGIGSWLASGRLLRDATACLAALGDDGDDPEGWGDRADGASSTPALGSEAFDACVAHLCAIVFRSRQIEAEHAGVMELSWQLQAAMTGGDGAEGDPGRPGPNRGGAAESLRILLDRSRRAAASIDQDLSGLEDANERVASGARDQSEAVSRTATSVEALSDRIDRIARHSAEAVDACERAWHEADQGHDQVQSVIEGMDRLLTRIEANGRKVRRLEERSTEIGAIVDLIRGISGRTDMLALNATIESIRAGEHGRGFAVIAEEIRKLADRTAGATREVGALVEAIQVDAQESLRALGEEQSQMQAESQRLRETGCSLQRISQVAERSARLVEGISRSTRDQVQSTQDLVRVMQRISEVAQQTQERTAQARAFIRALKQSCGPWQRLAAADPLLLPAGGPADASPRATEGPLRRSLREDRAAPVSPSISPARPCGSPRHAPARVGVEGEPSR